MTISIKPHLRVFFNATLSVIFAIAIAVAVHTISVVFFTDTNIEEVKEDIVSKFGTSVINDSIPTHYKEPKYQKGAANSLAYLLTRLGDTIAVEDIQVLASELGSEVSSSVVVGWAHQLGYKLETSHMDYTDLPDESRLPVIVKLLNSHYVVVHRADAEGVVLFDPRFGAKVWVDAKVFKSQWGGLVLIVFLYSSVSL